MERFICSNWLVCGKPKYWSWETIAASPPCKSKRAGLAFRDVWWPWVKGSDLEDGLVFSIWTLSIILCLQRINTIYECRPGRINRYSSLSSSMYMEGEERGEGKWGIRLMVCVALSQEKSQIVFYFVHQRRE